MPSLIKPTDQRCSWPKPFQTLQESFPATPAPLPYHYAMIKDQNRIGAFKAAFERHLNPDDRVLEIGGGTGILSLLAEPFCKEVITVERDVDVYNYGMKFLNEKSKGKIQFLCGDIRNFRWLGRFDAVICEVMDTAFFSEAQIPLINFALNHFLKPDGHMFPQAAETTVELIHKDYHVEHLGVFPLPHYEAFGIQESPLLSEPVLFQKINFLQKNAEHYQISIVLKANIPCEVNSLRFRTITQVAGNIILQPSNWLNPLMIIPLSDSISLTKDEELIVNISYLAGRGLEHVKAEII
jgi:type I protein arginine methyltransferase